MRLAVEFADLLALGDFRSVAGRREEGRDARATRPAALGERPLRNQVHLELARQHLALELVVLADVAGDHLPDLLALQQQAEPKVVHSGVIGDAGQTRHAKPNELVDAVLGDSAQAESPEH